MRILEEKEIKQAINKQLETIEMNPYLKTKTMNYLATKSAAQKRRNRLIMAFSSVSIVALLLVVVIPNQFAQDIPQVINEGVAIQELSLDTPQATRGIEPEEALSVLMTKLNELSLNYELKVVYTNDVISIYKIKMDDSENFFINTKDVQSKDVICDIINELQINYPLQASEIQELQFDLNNYFIYNGTNEELIKFLGDKTEETSCE